MCFNPRAREGRDLKARFGLLSRPSFNPRAREGRDELRLLLTFTLSCFNPRAREGRDHHARTVTFIPLHVSIHAPARGATIWRGEAQRCYSVSIHAPARGATLCAERIPQQRKFQSTRPRGARPQVGSSSAINIAFQSTRPRGARPFNPNSLTIKPPNSYFRYLPMADGCHSSFR